MRFFRTLTQRRVLRWYWRGNEPFTVDTLLKENVLHNRLLGKIVLWSMERKGQIIRPVVGDPRYVGTTDSPEEWDRLLQIYKTGWCSLECGCLNRYESAEIITILERMIEEYRQSGTE